jgi:membrane associated rhomboid family serine protease
MNTKKLMFIKEDIKYFFKGLSLKDFLFISIFPFIILSMMFIFQENKSVVSLNISNPLWWQFFTSSFIHFDMAHLINNLMNYLIFIGLIIFYSNKINMKQQMYTLIFFIFISFSIISSLLQCLVFPLFIPLDTSQGSSGLISALPGIFPILIAAYYSKKYKINFLDEIFTLSSLFIGIIFMITYSDVNRNKNLLLILSTIILFIILLFKFNKNLKLLFLYINKEKNIFFIINNASLIILFALVPSISLFPTDFYVKGIFTDFITHYLGLCYGLIISYLYFKILNKKYL